jgi:hypothetical protein
MTNNLDYKGAFMRIIKLLLLIFILILMMVHFLFAAENKGKIAEIPAEIKAKVATVCHQPRLVTESDLDIEMRKYRDENRLAYNTIINADFNGDKLLDWALLVKCKSKDSKSLTEKLIILLQKKIGGYNIQVLEEFTEGLDDNLYFVGVPPKKVKEYDTDAIIKLKYRSIERIFDEKSSGIYYWDGNKFRYVQTSD